MLLGNLSMLRLRLRGLSPHPLFLGLLLRLLPLLFGAVTAFSCELLLWKLPSPFVSYPLENPEPCLYVQEQNLKPQEMKANERKTHVNI